MPEKTRSPRNKTLVLTEEDIKKYQPLLLTEKDFNNKDIDIINKTINADLNNVIDYIPNNFADLIIIDPPYNLTKNFGGKIFTQMDNDSYKEYLRSWLPQVCSKLKSNGSLYLCGDWKCTAALQEVLSENLTIINRITWQREKGRGALSNWKNGMEDIWFAVKNKNNYYFDVDKVKIRRRVIAPYKENGKPKDWESTENGNFRDTYPSNFWDDITIPFWSMPENTDHPTQKSEKLYAKLILASCPEEGIIFDPFLGSGTTSVVAKKLNRQYCGIEINQNYCLYAEKRLDQAENNKNIQGYKDNIFWERNSL